MTSRVVKSIGGYYAPPCIAGLPQIKDGTATIRLIRVLDNKEKKRLLAAFANYCDRQRIRLKLAIHEYIITIKEAADSILMAVLEYLEIVQPIEQTPATPKKPKTVMKAPRRKLHHLPHRGIHLAIG